MVEDIATDIFVVASLTTSGLAYSKLMRRNIDGFTAEYFDLEGTEYEEFSRMLKEEQPDLEEFYRMIGGDKIEGEATGCWVHYPSEWRTVSGRLQAMEEYARERTEESYDNWEWLADITESLDSRDFADYPLTVSYE